MPPSTICDLQNTNCFVFCRPSIFTIAATLITKRYIFIYNLDLLLFFVRYEGICSLFLMLWRFWVEYSSVLRSINSNQAYSYTVINTYDNGIKSNIIPCIVIWYLTLSYYSIYILILEYVLLYYHLQSCSTTYSPLLWHIVLFYIIESNKTPKHLVWYSVFVFM